MLFWGGSPVGYLENLWNALDFGSLWDLLLRLVSVFLCLTVHETCHGLAALALGDPTAKRARRLSLNPLRHIDWFGLLMMVTVGFGWAKPVPVDPRYFRRPKQGMALTALAGPVSNFLLALVLLFAGRLVYDYAPYSEANQRLLTFLLTTAILSLGLGLFNLIPIPPLDGSKIVAYFLPPRAAWAYMSAGRYGFIILVLLLATGLLGHILGPLIGGGSDLLLSLVGIK